MTEMINAIVIDKVENSALLLKKNLDEIEGVNCRACYQTFEDIECELKEIDLIIFDIEFKTSEETLMEVFKLKSRYKNLDFIAASYEINSELVSKTLKRDVGEFLIKPVIGSILSGAIKKIKDIKNNVKISKAKTICFFSNKGGIGKTSSALNVGYEIANQTDEKTCLLDLSFNWGDLSGFVDIEPKYNIAQAVEKLEHADEALALTICQKYRNTDFYVMTFKENYNFSKVNSDTVVKLINSLKNIFSYIVIDLASTIDETTLGVLNNSDLIVLLGMLNMASVRNSQKCFELFENIGISQAKVRYIINRYIDNSEIKLMDVKKALGCEVFYKIPNNYLTLIDAMNAGSTVIETNPNSNISKAYSKLASEILNTDFINLNELAPQGYNHGIFNLLRRMGE